MTFYTDKNGTVRTQFSHGNLEMGVSPSGLTSDGATAIFGSAEGSDTYGSLRFTNIIYKSGTIKLRLNSATEMNTLNLTSYAQKNSSDGTYTDVTGGTLSFADGVSDTTKVTFDFGTNLDWLTKYDDTSDGVKIISWDALKKSTLLVDDFAGNIYKSSNGDYKAEFSVADDGLYVKYVAVPEPADIALLIGFCTMAIVCIRRRK